MDGAVSGKLTAEAVQKTLLSPAEKLTAAPAFDEARIDVRASVHGEPLVSVPMPTSHSAPPSMQ